MLGDVTWVTSERGLLSVGGCEEDHFSNDIFTGGIVSTFLHNGKVLLTLVCLAGCTDSSEMHTISSRFCTLLQLVLFFCFKMLPFIRFQKCVNPFEAFLQKCLISNSYFFTVCIQGLGKQPPDRISSQIFEARQRRGHKC